ncbi:MAG: endonuclease V, partial [Bacteroidetes bacterium]
ASWLGISLGIPTMGVAKRSLLKETGMPPEKAGSALPLIRAGKLVGHVVRTQTGIRPLYVSAGHLISQQQALQLALQLRGRYRIIEPLRRADQAARQYAKGLSLPQAVVLQ